MARMHAPKDPKPGGGMAPGATVQKRRCPMCGGLFGQLPKHLPTCDGGGDE